MQHRCGAQRSKPPGNLGARVADSGRGERQREGTHRITEVDWVGIGVAVEIQPACQPNRVLLRKPARSRAMPSRAVDRLAQAGQRPGDKPPHLRDVSHRGIPHDLGIDGPVLVRDPVAHPRER